MKLVTPEGYTFVTKFQEINSHKVLRSVEFFSIKFDEIFFDTVCWVSPALCVCWFVWSSWMEFLVVHLFHVPSWPSSMFAFMIICVEAVVWFVNLKNVFCCNFCHAIVILYCIIVILYYYIVDLEEAHNGLGSETIVIVAWHCAGWLLQSF